MQSSYDTWDEYDSWGGAGDWGYGGGGPSFGGGGWKGKGGKYPPNPCNGGKGPQLVLPKGKGGVVPPQGPGAVAPGKGQFQPAPRLAAPRLATPGEGLASFPPQPPVPTSGGKGPQLVLPLNKGGCDGKAGVGKGGPGKGAFAPSSGPKGSGPAPDFGGGGGKGYASGGKFGGGPGPPPPQKGGVVPPPQFGSLTMGAPVDSTVGSMSTSFSLGLPGMGATGPVVGTNFQPPPPPIMGGSRPLAPIPPPVAPPRPPLPLMPPLTGPQQGGFSFPSGQVIPPPDMLALPPPVEVDDGPQDGKITIAPPEVKPRIYLLFTRLSPDLREEHMQQILEQCGEVTAWRRAKDATGNVLTFGFALFGDPEAAWKASVCMMGLKLCGQEIKVLVEEGAEQMISKWRTSQKLALKVNTEEELSWELERKSVTCRAAIDAVIEEIYGAPADGTGGSGAYTAQRKQELRERETARRERAAKRKAWREEEFAQELERVEQGEKRLRAAERDRDDADRNKEASESRSKEEEGSNALARLEDTGRRPPVDVLRLANDQQLCEMVDRVQMEPRDRLFKMDLDVAFLRNERIFEKKLRPWLERKIEISMGGPQTDLVEYILRRVNGNSHPDALTSDLTRYLDDSAELLIERMWRMLAFELMRGGLALSNPLK